MFFLFVCKYACPFLVKPNKRTYGTESFLTEASISAFFVFVNRWTNIRCKRVHVYLFVLISSIQFKNDVALRAVFFRRYSKPSSTPCMADNSANDMVNTR